MKAIETHKLTPADLAFMSEIEKLWVYNGLDCCVTAEVFEVLRPQLDLVTLATYEFSKALQAPVLEMKIRGILVDRQRRDEVVSEYEALLRRLAGNLYAIVADGIGFDAFNWASNADLQDLLYGRLKIPPIKKQNAKRDFAATVDRDALEQLGAYFFAQPIVSHLLRLRDIGKKVGVLKTAVDPDGRMRTSYNIAGTTTGRFSSNLSDFGTGTNLQNIEELLRSIFVADPGMKFAYIDLEQAESRLVGAIEWNLFGDGRYLDACESGDLHTAVCRLAWPRLPWTGHLAQDREIAERPFYRQHSYRRMAKVLGHGTNYNGKPYTMAKHTRLDARLIAEFQANYFSAFPAHQRWHGRVASDLLTQGCLTSLSGRRRWFFGRRNDDAIIREAIAFDPQGSVGDILNRGMLQVWRRAPDLKVQLLLQVHDAVLIQYPQEIEDELLPQALRTIEVPIPLRNGRTLLIPAEAKTGWNWSIASQNNPDGLRTWPETERRRRSRPAPTQLDRGLHALQLELANP